MLRIITLAALLASAAPAAVLAQTTAASPASGAQGVIRYPQAYFAEQRPVTAYDMVGRLPGFTLDTGDNVRGFEGAAGNVLIDGEYQQRDCTENARPAPDQYQKRCHDINEDDNRQRPQRTVDRRFRIVCKYPRQLMIRQQ